MLGAVAAPMLDWLEVEMGDMLSSVSVGVDKLSYDEGLLEVFPQPPLDLSVHLVGNCPAHLEEGADHAKLHYDISASKYDIQSKRMNAGKDKHTQRHRGSRA